MESIFSFKSSLLLILLSIVLLPNLYSQENIDWFTQGLQRGIQSPQAASLAKVGEVPVNYYTGKANISIPLYSENHQALDLNIGLNYDTGGNKVEQPESWVGLGWSLNYGGVITRTVKGLADDSPQGYKTTSNKLITAWSSVNSSNVIESIDDAQFLPNYITEVTGGQADPEPDQFFFNFGGNSGQFYLDENGVPTIVPNTNFDIQYIESTSWNECNQMVVQCFTKFIITSSTGRKYIFEAKEYSGPNLEDAAEYVSSWYLTKIESEIGEKEVIISYSPLYIVDDYKYFHEVTFSSTEAFKQYYLRKHRYNHVRYPQSISTPSKNMELMFSDRNGGLVPTDKKLDQLIIRNKQNDEINRWKFNYDFSTNRLTLNSIQVFSNNGMSDFPPYKFTYNATPLPVNNNQSQNNDIFRQDKYGYYTSYSDGSNLLPSVALIVPDQMVYVRKGAGSRKPSSSHTKASILEKIEYPQGGTVEFEYENNEYSKISNSNDQLIDDNIIEVVQSLHQTNFIDQIDQDFFNVSVGGEFFEVDVEVDCTNTADPCLTNDIFFELADQANSEVLFQMGTFTIPAECRLLDAPELDLIINGTCFVFLPNSGPNAKTYIATSRTKGVGMKTTARYRRYNRVPVDNIMGSGLRISKIIYHDKVSGTNNSISYSYDLESSPGISSGVLVQEPRHLYYSDIFNSAGQLIKEAFSHSGFSNTGLGSTSGSSIGYREVTVKYGINGVGGSTVYKYSAPDSYPNELPELSLSPITTVLNQDWKRGKLLEKIVTDNNDNIVTKEISEYKIIDNSSPNSSGYAKSIRGFNLQTFGHVIRNAGQSYLASNPNPFHVYKTYELNMGALFPEKKTVKIFNGNQNNPVVIETDYFFEDPLHLLMTKKVETNSITSEKRITTIEYAHEQDGSSGSPNYSTMFNENMLSQPYSILVEDASGNDISKTWIKWNENISGASGTWLLNQIWNWKGTGIAPSGPSTSNSVKISEVQVYDAFGNPNIVVNEFGQLTKFYFGSNTQPFTQNGLNGVNGIYLTGIQKQNGGSVDEISSGVRPPTGDDLFTETEYDNFGRITKVIDENEQATSYVYDSFNRLVKTENPEGAITRSNYYYSAIADGTFDSTSPNFISSVSGTDGYESDFSSSSDFNSYGDRRFNHYFQGDITLRLGDSSGDWSSVYRSPGAEDVHAKVDVFLSSTYSSGSKPYLLAFNDNNNRFAVRYSYSNDKLEILRRKNGGSYQTVHIFSINASPDKWYTVELEKKAGILMAWVYERDGSRSTGDYYSDAGYPTNWKPQVRMWSDDDYLYFTNFEYTSNPLSSISYLDGLGREIQTQVRAGDKVITSETLYNDRGLPEVVSRPIEESATNIPGFYSNGLLSGGNAFTSGTAMPSTAPVGAYYSANHGGANDNDEFYAYSYTQYEASPLARVEKSTLPGEDHQTNNNLAITTSYGLNTSETFTVNGKTWGVNTLSKTVSRDPDGKETISYTDGWGRTIASGVNMNPNSDDALDDSSDLITKFAYDEQGNLVLVEDPRGLVTTYTYNTLGQLISKKLPDQEYSVNYKYDEAGRLRFTQDPNQQSSKQDLSHSLSGSTSVTKTIVANGEGTLSLDFYVFDLYMNDYEFQIEKVNVGTNTIIYQNSFSPDGGAIGPLFFNVLPGEYKFIGTAVDSGEPIAGSNGTFGFISNDVFTYTKYDNLNRPTEVGEYAGGTTFAAADADNDTFPTTGNSANIMYYYDGDQVYSGSLIPQNLKGRLSKVSYRDLSVSSGTMGHTYYSYNTIGLVEWVVQDLPGLSIKKIEYDYDEIGRLTQLSFQGGVSGEQFYQKYSYDELGRLEELESSSDGISWIKEASYTYFADGQVDQVVLGNNSAQTVDYAYTIQGWLDKINNGAISTGTNGDRFGMNLSYSNNGNITQQQWRQVGTSGTNQNQLSYAYSYDNANRLTAANFSGSGYNSAAFDLEWMNYDKNGNITGYLRRNNNGNIGYDGIGYYGLNYETGTNRISQLVEQVDYMNFDIDHDASGNMIKNQMQGFTSVDYDWRNLPAQMVAGSSTLQYAYDADGNRVKKKLTNGVETHYVRGAHGETIAVYEDDVLQFHNILAGSEPIGSWDGSQRRYFLKDHLGSVRTTVDQNGNVDGYDDYYPFGLAMPGRSSNSANPNDQYKFTGHERDNEAGLNLIHMNARTMDPVTGRFLQVDPYASKYPSLSPYAYVANNPINALDPDGRLIVFINGFHFGNHLEPNSYTYWTQANRFAHRVMNHFNDHNSIFIDGSIGGIFNLANNLDDRFRYDVGYARGKRDAAKLIGLLAPEETLKIVTHSMGSVYGKGYVKAIMEYIRNSDDPKVRKTLISLVADFDPYEAGGLFGSANPDIFTQQFWHDGGLFGLADQVQAGVDENNEDKKQKRHGLNTFLNDIENLREGTYEWDEDKEEWICTSCQD